MFLLVLILFDLVVELAVLDLGWLFDFCILMLDLVGFGVLDMLVW